MQKSKSSLSLRGEALIDKPLRADLDYFNDAADNQYDSVTNPTGAISLCIAENALSWEDVQQRLQQISHHKYFPDWIATYTDVRGAPIFREALAKFATKHLSTIGGKQPLKLEAANFAVASGATAIIELTALLLGDPGDVVILPAPSYQGYRPDVELKAQLERRYISCTTWTDSPGQHPLQVTDLEATRKLVEQEGKKVCMLVLTQPDNPTGTIYSKTQLEAFADWAVAHQVHLCVNEIYALSQFDVADPRLAEDYKQPVEDFYSFLRIIQQRKNPYLHWWYSFSKDFGISGLRCGILSSKNESFLKSFGNLGAPHTVSNHTQWLLCELVSNSAWVSAFAKTNQSLVTEAYALAITRLREAGVAYRVARGSLFIWAHLNTREDLSDEEFWRKLYEEKKVLLTAPGGYGETGKGWFRIVFSAVSLDALEEALHRILSK